MAETVLRGAVVMAGARRSLHSAYQTYFNRVDDVVENALVRISWLEALLREARYYMTDDGLAGDDRREFESLVAKIDAALGDADD